MDEIDDDALALLDIEALAAAQSTAPVIAAEPAHRVPPLLILAYNVITAAEEAELKALDAPVTRLEVRPAGKSKALPAGEFESWTQSLLEAGRAQHWRNPERDPERVAEIRARYAAVLAPVRDALNDKLKGMTRCVGPLGPESDDDDDRYDRASDDYDSDEYEDEDLLEMHAKDTPKWDFNGMRELERRSCGRLFLPAGGRHTRCKPPHIVFPGVPVPGSRGRTTLPDEFCVCDLRADLCPNCLPKRKECELCSERFCSFCMRAHFIKCEAAHRDMCRVCRRRGVAGRRCKALDVDDADSYWTSCKTRICETCLERCDAERFDGPEGAVDEDGRCTTRICPTHKGSWGGFCEPCADRKAQKWDPEASPLEAERLREAKAERLRRKRLREEARDLKWEFQLSLTDGKSMYRSYDYPHVDEQLAAWKRAQPASWHEHFNYKFSDDEDGW